ncbi:MAG TPA: hypothetical protein VHR47_14500 [Bacillota bacterium]|nr:hypothetical protein [Bacillota bacterium]
MKKTLSLLLAIVFTLSVASATVAADLSYWYGGDFFFYFDSQEKGLIESGGSFMVGQSAMVKVTSGNTYAQAWLNEDKWRTPNGMWRYAFGWNKIGDVLDIGFSSKDTSTINIGQALLTSTFNSFHADPVFNSCDLDWGANAVLTVGNFAIKTEYCLHPEDGMHDSNSGLGTPRGEYGVAFVAKLDSGDIHLGYKSVPQVMADDKTLVLLGGSFNIGEANLKVDIWKDKLGAGNYSNDDDDIGIVAPGTGASGKGVQANFGIDKVDVTLLCWLPDTDNIENVLGVGANYKFTDKFTLGGKFLTHTNTLNKNAWEAYGLYNVGAFDVKFGAMNTGREMDKANTADDTSIILGFHANLF